MNKVTIYHNPRCSKSRQTLDIIRSCSREPEIIDYLVNPPTVQQLDSLCSAMGKTPLELMRVTEPLFTELGLSKEDRRSRREWLEIMVKNPKLIERPIVVCDGKVALGRPPETVLDIL